MNELLRSYVQEGTVDADRIYVLGGSMGGTGTWCQLSYFPDFYAAALVLIPSRASTSRTERSIGMAYLNYTYACAYN